MANTQQIKETIKGYSSTIASKSSDLLSKSGDLLSKGDPRKEDNFTKALETQTAKLPSSTWLGLAIGSMILSAGLELFSSRKEYGNFVGLWAPSFLLIGIYNKLVKLEGFDQYDKEGVEPSQAA